MLSSRSGPPLTGEGVEVWGKQLAAGNPASEGAGWAQAVVPRELPCAGQPGPRASPGSSCPLPALTFRIPVAPQCRPPLTAKASCCHVAAASQLWPLSNGSQVMSQTVLRPPPALEPSPNVLLLCTWAAARLLATAQPRPWHPLPVQDAPWPWLSTQLRR